jgi:hypothetical protein
MAAVLVFLEPEKGPSAPPPALFEEIDPHVSGITWANENLISPGRYLPESMVGGVAFLDFDNDGWMDVFLPNVGPCDFFKPEKPLKNALYHNNRDGTFTDVTDKAGIAGGTFAMGVAVGDYNSDGFPDIFVSAYGRCLLYRNNRDGTFAEVSQQAGVSAPGWTTSAVWFDYDNDGRLDLFVNSFVEYSKEKNLVCGDNRLGRKFYCIPRVFIPTHNFLFHNNGDGTFTEVEKGTEIEQARSKGMGVVAADINNDGLVDLFSANDTVQNYLFMNRGPNQWEEIGLASGVGFSDNGQARSGMGVDAADIDGDGWVDLYVANVDQEMFSLYHNNQDESFTDEAHKHGIAEDTRLLSGWGIKFFDFDNDGWPDMFQCNGHPDDMIENYSTQVKYKELCLLYHNEKGKLHNISAGAGPIFSQPLSCRGLAIGDYNNDGKIDVLLGLNQGTPILLKNNAPRGNHWLGVNLRGTRSNPDAVGARITWSSGGITRSRQKRGGGSYLSYSDPREVLGLGENPRLDWLEIKWPLPNGTVEHFTSLPIDRYITIVEGQGIKP